MAALVFTGLVIGSIGGLFGVSGCFLLTPILAELFGIRYDLAAGSASVHAIGIAATGLRRHLRVGGVDLKLGLVIACGAMAGALCGSQVMKHLGTDYSKDVLDTTARCVQVLVLAFIAFMIARPPKGGGHRTILQRIPLGPRRPVPGIENITFSMPGAIGLAFCCGLVAGFLGLGGGVVYLPLMILAVGAAPHAAVHVALIITLCSAIASTINYSSANKASLAVAMLLMVGSSVGVQFGSYICHKIQGNRIRKYFSLVVLAAMGLVLWKLVASFMA